VTLLIAYQYLSPLLEQGFEKVALSEQSDRDSSRAREESQKLFFFFFVSFRRINGFGIWHQMKNWLLRRVPNPLFLDPLNLFTDQETHKFEELHKKRP
jgi:hypothetical protein